VRPGYPDAVYERMIDYGALTRETRVLEVGVGTGKATIPLVERGFEVHGVEPGPQLAAVARANMACFPKVAITTTTFEAWPVVQDFFGLAFSAQAFHWLDPEQRLARFALSLRSDGVLAIFGNVPRVSSSRLRDDVTASYQAFAPSLAFAREAENWYATAASPVMTELAASPFFRDVEFTAFEWQRTLDASSYCQLLSTYSDHSTLPADELAALLASIADVVQRHGGEVTVSYTTGLFLARRRAAI
jgi:SAM-dependent methyltransferase